MARTHRVLMGAALAVLAAAAFAGQAAAHGGDPNYRSKIDKIVPGVSGISAEILNYDADLQLTNHSDQDVTVFGYEKEPYLRIAADGTVEVNTNSPAYYLNEDRYADVAVPANAKADASPAWKEIDKSGTYTWHDHRSHYMGKGTAPQVKDESKKTKVFDYSIPIQVGDQKGDIDGTLFWVGPEDSGFPAAPFIGLGVLVLVLGGIVVARRRRDPAAKEAW